MSLVRFFYAAKKTGEDKNGLPVFEDVPWVRITRDSTHTVEREKEEDDEIKYPGQWAFFLKKETPKDLDGLPIAMWPMARPADVENLAGHGIYTVQQLAKANQSKMPANIKELAKKAKEYQNIAGKAGALQKELESAKLEIEDLREANKELKAEISMLKRKALEAA